jgi:SAM-dependent methyltransferase
MELVNCDFCNSSEAEIVVSQKDVVHRCAPPTQQFSLTKCQQCSLIYLNPRPSPDEMASFYPESYEFYSGRKLFLYWLRTILVDLCSAPYLNRLLALGAFSPIIRKYFVKLVQPRKPDFVRFIKPGQFLDIGCGSGLNTHFWGYRSSLDYLKKQGFEVVGLEPSEQARNIAKSHGLQVAASFFEIGDRVFDCIRLNWSLEHVDSPSKYFEFFQRHLKPGGKLIIAVPNYDGLLYRIFPECVEVPVHTYYFTPKTLEAYLKKYYFEVLDHYTFSYPGMFVFASEILEHKPPLTLSPFEVINFQSLLNKFDAALLGNDMVYFCERK